MTTLSVILICDWGVEVMIMRSGVSSTLILPDARADDNLSYLAQLFISQWARVNYYPTPMTLSCGDVTTVFGERRCTSESRRVCG